jgi:dihydrofolate synthase/folylpolyglutamate synthase
VLQNAGQKVGTYTSPHLIEYRERIRVAGRDIDEFQLLRAFAAVEVARRDIPLTFFEFGTLTALWVFQQAAVGVAILEVGMGGRLDPVNTEVPDVALLTPISIDHEKWLGSDTEQIGAEKAGILKFRGKAVVNDPNAPDSVMSRIHSLRCKCLQYGRDYVDKRVGEGWSWHPSKTTEGWLVAEHQLPKPSLLGEHQVINAAGIVAVLKLLGSQVVVPRAALVEGLRAQSIRGRLEVYRGPPEVIVDVAHNLSAAKRLVEFLKKRSVAGRTLGVFCMLRDKPAGEIVQQLRGTIDCWHITSLQEERALSVVELEKEIRAHVTGSVHCWDTPRDALYGALGDAQNLDRIVVFGSAYLAGAILQILDHESSKA